MNIVKPRLIRVIGSIFLVFGLLCFIPSSAVFAVFEETKLDNILSYNDYYLYDVHEVAKLLNGKATVNKNVVYLYADSTLFIFKNNSNWMTTKIGKKQSFTTVEHDTRVLNNKGYIDASAVINPLKIPNMFLSGNTLYKGNIKTNIGTNSVSLFKAESNLEFEFSYQIAVPKSVKKFKKVNIILESSNGPNRSYSDVERNGYNAAQNGMQRLASPTESIYVTINIPKENPTIENSKPDILNSESMILTADKFYNRADKQVISILKRVRTELYENGYLTNDKIILYGSSDSARFAKNFSIIYPEMVQMVIGEADSMFSVPLESKSGLSLPYPIGIYDYKTIFGRSFDRESYDSIYQLHIRNLDDSKDPIGHVTPYWEAVIRKQAYGETTNIRIINQLETLKLSSTNVNFKFFDSGGHAPTLEGDRLIIDFINQYKLK